MLGRRCGGPEMRVSSTITPTAMVFRYSQQVFVFGLIPHTNRSYQKIGVCEHEFPEINSRNLVCGVCRDNQYAGDGKGRRATFGGESQPDRDA